MAHWSICVLNSYLLSRVNIDYYLWCFWPFENQVFLNVHFNFKPEMPHLYSNSDLENLENLNLTTMRESRRGNFQVSR